jgi:hypothetical protein
MQLSTPPRAVRMAAAAAAGLSGAVLLVACGGSAHGTSGSTATPSSSGSGRGGFGRNSLYSDPKVQQCLRAAGLTVPTPTFTGPRPSFSGSARPSFTGPRPSGTNRGGGFLGGAEGAKIQQALKACGISLPQRTGGRTDAAPSSTATG